VWAGSIFEKIHTPIESALEQQSAVAGYTSTVTATATVVVVFFEAVLMVSEAGEVRNRWNAKKNCNDT
jgi:hypothetical protein